MKGSILLVPYDTTKSFNILNYFLPDFLMDVIKKCQAQFMARYTFTRGKFKLQNGSISRSDLRYTFAKAFLMIFQKHSARYTGRFNTKELKKYFIRIQTKMDPKRRIFLNEMCNVTLLKERNTTSILSYGYHRI